MREILKGNRLGRAENRARMIGAGGLSGELAFTRARLGKAGGGAPGGPKTGLTAHRIERAGGESSRGRDEKKPPVEGGLWARGGISALFSTPADFSLAALGLACSAF